jgi:hypothetical protein
MGQVINSKYLLYFTYLNLKSLGDCMSDGHIKWGIAEGTYIHTYTALKNIIVRLKTVWEFIVYLQCRRCLGKGTFACYYLINVALSSTVMSNVRTLLLSLLHSLH